MDVLKQLHTSVAEAFEKSFDDAYRNFNSELAFHDARVRDAERRVTVAEEARDNAVSETAALKDEITLLNEELRQNSIDSKDNKFANELSRQLKLTYEPQLVLGGLDATNTSPEDLSNICNKYRELYQQALTLVLASGDLRTQVKRHKRKLEHFQMSLKRQEFSFVVEGAPVKFLRVPNRQTRDHKGLSGPGLALSVAEQLRPISHRPAEKAPTQSQTAFGSQRDHSSADMHAKDKQRDRHGKQTLPPNSESALPPSDTSTSTDETQGTPAPTKSSTTDPGSLKRKRAGIHEPPSRDSPLRRLRRSNSSGQPDHPITIKSEIMSSSPLLASSPHWGPTGTQDLDDIGNTVETPTRRNQTTSIQNRQVENIANISASPSRRKLEPPSHMAPPNDLPSNRPGVVLHPVDGNLRFSNRIRQLTSKRGPKSSGKLSKTAIASVAEDGDEKNILQIAKKINMNSPKPTPIARNSSSRICLKDLLERAPPTHRLLSTSGSQRSPNKSRSRSTVATNTTTNPKVNSLNKGQNHTDNQVNQIQGPDQLEVSPEDEPFRARPLQRLGLDHFKLNPNYNQGLDFAFDEVVRKGDQRRCIDGCTRPGCCGEKFLAMARFGFSANPSGSRQREEEDQEILEEYLGDEKERVDSLSPEERQNLLEEARARSLANRFGRHRHQHQRPGTPPGFWRTDMPGTQELERDREDAHKVEREKVKDRYREAMRPGGRWKFADE